MTAVLLGGHVSGSSWEVVGNSLWSVLVPYIEMFCFCFIMRCRSLSPSCSLHVVLPFLPRNAEVNVRLICLRCISPQTTVFWQQKDERWEARMDTRWMEAEAGASLDTAQCWCPWGDLLFQKAFILSLHLLHQNLEIWCLLWTEPGLPCGLFC